jgi:hypothetical protein
LDPSRCAGWGGKEKRVSSMVVNFPDGSKEFLYPSRELKEGDAVWHNGVRFRVLSIVQNDGRPLTVTVESVSDELGDLRSEEGGLVLAQAD